MAWYGFQMSFVCSRKVPKPDSREVNFSLHSKLLTYPLEAPHIPHEEILLYPVLGKYLLKPTPDGLYGLGVSFGLWGNGVLGVVDPLMLYV